MPSVHSRVLPLFLAASAATLCCPEAQAQTPPGPEIPETQPSAIEPPAPAPLPPPPPAPAETYPRMGKSREIQLGKNTWFRLGLHAQVWADLQQSATPVNGSDGGYQANLFLRRARIIIGGQFLEGVSIYALLDAPRLGLALAGGTAEAPTATKRFNGQDGGGETIADFFGEVKLAGDALMLEGGLMYVPLARAIFTASATQITLDGATISTFLPATSAQRDLGFQLKGYLLDDHLEYRVGLFSGTRQPANAAEGNPIAHNFFRVAGYAQYNLLDTEKGYTFLGQNFGKKKVLGFDAGFDFQKNDAPQTDPYFAIAAGAFGSYPLSGEGAKEGGDEIAFLLQYYHYDGGGATGAAPALPRQNDLLAEVTYYNKALGLGVFGKVELELSSDDAAKATNTQWFGGGLKYFVAENNCNFTLAYNHVQLPDAPTTGTGAKNATNEFTLQMQVYYY